MYLRKCSRKNNSESNEQNKHLEFASFVQHINQNYKKQQLSVELYAFSSLQKYFAFVFRTRYDSLFQNLVGIISAITHCIASDKQDIVG